MQPETEDTLMGAMRGMWYAFKPGAYVAAVAIAMTAAQYLLDNPKNTAHADTKAEQPAPPGNYAINQFILK